MADYDGYLAMEDGILDLCESALADLAGHGTLIANCRPDYDLDRLWRTWLADPTTARAVGRKAAELLAANRGAVDRTLEIVEPTLPE